jgi:Uma2 family endonuclease
MPLEIKMTILTATKFWTDAELLALPGGDGCDREIIDGELVVSPANPYHGRSIGRLFAALGTFVYEHGLGEVVDGQTGVRMADGSLLSPDISFVTTASWNAFVASGETFFTRSPELVVEVLSPSDTVNHIDRKLELYFANGTQLMWVVHPRSKTVHVHHRPIADRVLTATETLDGEDVLPGFKCEIARLF